MVSAKFSYSCVTKQQLITRAALQSTLDAFQERYGRTTTVNEFLHAEYNGLSAAQLRSLIPFFWFQRCGADPALTCRPGSRCHCIDFYRANGYLLSPARNMDILDKLNRSSGTAPARICV